LLYNRKEIEALERKLEIAELQLILETQHSRKVIDSLEMQVSKFSLLLELSLQKDHHFNFNITQELANQQGTGDNVGGDKVGNDKIGRDKI
jgi:hypothetical protein